MGAGRTEYNAIKKDVDRRAWIAQFVLDPSFSRTEGVNSTLAISKSATKEDELWLTAEQLEGVEYYGSFAHHVIKAGELETRPHESTTLAKLDVVQYRFVKKWKHGSVGSEESHGTRSVVELTDAEYREVTDKVLDGERKGTKRKVPVKPKVEETGEQKEIKRCVALRSSAVRRCKALLDKAASDTLLDEEYGKLRAKGYPEAMEAFYKTKVEVFVQKIKVSQASFAQEATRVEAKPTLAEINKACVAVETIIKTLDADYKSFKEQVLNDLRKLIS